MLLKSSGNYTSSLKVLGYILQYINCQDADKKRKYQKRAT